MSTVEELRERASELDIEGRSGMNKEELRRAVAKAELEAEIEGESATDVSAEQQVALESSDEAGLEVEQDQGTPVVTAKDSSGRGVGFLR